MFFLLLFLDYLCNTISRYYILTKANFQLQKTKAI